MEKGAVLLAWLALTTAYKVEEKFAVSFDGNPSSEDLRSYPAKAAHPQQRLSLQVQNATVHKRQALIGQRLTARNANLWRFLNTVQRLRDHYWESYENADWNITLCMEAQRVCDSVGANCKPKFKEHRDFCGDWRVPESRGAYVDTPADEYIKGSCFQEVMLKCMEQYSNLVDDNGRMVDNPISRRLWQCQFSKVFSGRSVRTSTFQLQMTRQRVVADAEVEEWEGDIGEHILSRALAEVLGG